MALVGIVLCASCSSAKEAEDVSEAPSAERPAGWGDPELRQYIGCWRLEWENEAPDRTHIGLLTPDSIALFSQFIIGDQQHSRRIVVPATQEEGRGFDINTDDFGAMTWEWLFRGAWWEKQGRSIRLHFTAGNEGFWDITLSVRDSILDGAAAAGTGDTAQVRAFRIGCDDAQ